MDKEEYIERGALVDILNSKSDMAIGTPKAVFANAAKIAELMPAADVVSREVLEQVKWERDVAMQQLEEHGIPFGGKADVVAVVRCKDCVYFQPNFVETNNGERRPYTEEEKNSPLGMVTCDVGVNCGSRCERFDYWEDNRFPVWFQENDFCSYGKRKEQT